MNSVGLGVAAACLASALYNTAISLQASEARSTSLGLGFRAGLMYQLVRRPRWIGGLLLGIAAASLQVAALLFAPLTIVQPTLAVGLLLLLFIGRRKLGEPVGKRELICVLAIILGVCGLAWSGPPRTTEHARFAQLIIAIGPLACVACLPLVLSFSRYRGLVVGYLAAVGAGLWYACGSLSAKFIADGVAQAVWLFVFGWIAAAAIAASLGLLSESTALQGRPASRVAPVIFVVEMMIPVMLAPLLASEHWSTHPLRLAVLLSSLLLVVSATVVLTSSEKLAFLSFARDDGAAQASTTASHSAGAVSRGGADELQ